MRYITATGGSWGVVTAQDLTKLYNKHYINFIDKIIVKTLLPLYPGKGWTAIFCAMSRLYKNNGFDYKFFPFMCNKILKKMQYLLLLQSSINFNNSWFVHDKFCVYI